MLLNSATKVVIVAYCSKDGMRNGVGITLNEKMKRRVLTVKRIWNVEEPWPRGRMPDSGAREPGFESSTYDGAVDGDTLWRQQNKILVIVLGNKL